ncbi:MAG TPA: type IV secretion system DNA-binding domain-containing protein [Solirubrobacteraceae bacterium]|nr:type IV secretion system DNA-binding domain-containing protein [Solirubrobacteraceae bacterium]
MLACGLAAFTCQRFTPLRWNVGLALALFASPFAFLPALAAAAGIVLAASTAPDSGAGWRRAGVVAGGWLALGRDDRGHLVRVPLRSDSGAHGLIVGATGSGKTVTEAWIIARAIDHGHAAVIIDPKGDALLRDSAREAARAAGRRFLEWTPTGPCAYNPYAHGSAGEIADKALAGETYSEPHYLRQAQRYLAHAVRAAGAGVTPRRLLELMDPRALELAARAMPDETAARDVFAYLDSLDARQRAGLAGTRDRLAILVESELGRWLEPATGSTAIDLLEAVGSRAVVYFQLDADRLPLLARMLGAAIVQDLLTVAAACQRNPVPAVVAIDEFSAIGAAGVARLFGRARAAGLSLLLATQELADLRDAGGELLDQVLGNVETVIAHRQSVPASAELIAQIIGTRTVWTRTEQLSHGFPTGRSTRTRAREYAIHPDAIKALAPGSAAVAGANGCAIARIFHP